MLIIIRGVAAVFAAFLSVASLQAQGYADLVLINGKIVTVDDKFSVHQALAVKDRRIEIVGSNEQVLSRAGPNTQKIDLKGRTAIPGLIDSHTHPIGAGLSELRGPLPSLRSIEDVLRYVSRKARELPQGRWIEVPRTFPTRLKEERLPTREELDAAAPNHPVFFDASYTVVVNSYALRLAGITRDTPQPYPGQIVKDPKTGEPTGLLQGAQQLIDKVKPRPDFTWQERLSALKLMLRRYNEVGITSIIDRALAPEDIKLYEELKRTGSLSVRAYLTVRIDGTRPIDEITDQIKSFNFSTGSGDELLRIGSLKVTMDGGMLIGTAYMRQAYGPMGMKVYGHTDPGYRGLLFIPEDKLVGIVRAARERGWQMTAHAVGGAAMDVLLNAYEVVDGEKTIKGRRFTITHGNFPDLATFERCRRLGVVVDVQPAWLYKDADVLMKVLGEERMRLFIPLRSWLEAGIIVGGGSDHMLGHDPLSSINPYNPFLGMWIAVARRTEKGTAIYPEERLRREDALRLYTRNNAYLMFAEEELGSLEPGKLADIAVLSDDLLACPEDRIKDIKVDMTILGGRIVYRR